jgi:hypothetical protein
VSRLYRSEDGHVVPTLCEELSRFRRARKVLWLPSTSRPAILYLLARPYPHCRWALRLTVNGEELQPLAPTIPSAYRWYSIELDPALLKAGDNRFVFWTDASAMDAWSLALEAGHARPKSWISDDGGETWRNHKMGYLNVLRGEYVVRVRMAEGLDRPPPRIIWEPPDSPRLVSLRQVMPSESLNAGSQMACVRALTGWLSTSWEYTNSAMAAQYAPWDAETILAWGKAQAGHHGRRPIVMCVHYAAAFSSCCQAAGIPTRCAILWDKMNGSDGHFVAEVWFEEYDKWVMVDPNLDAIFWRNGKPLSLPEIRAAGEDLVDLVEWGPGTAFQRQSACLAAWLEDAYLNGVCFRHRSVWWRADLLARPELSPPGHGSLAYCETGLIWEQRDLTEGFGMFPFFANAAFFDEPP